MDYPKSVPGVGLVNGLFVNEDPATGQLGSIIPAEWGNALMSELFSVMAKRGVTPDETKFNQLAEVIFALATANAAGMVQLANAAEAAAGTNATKAITPALLRQEISKIPDPSPAPGDASSIQKGIIQLATSAEAAAGTNGTKAVTPALLKQEADKRLPVLGSLPALVSTGPIELQLRSAAGNVNVVRGFVADVTAWQAGVSDASGDLVLFSATHNASLRISSDRIRASKPLYFENSAVITEATALGSGQAWINATASRAIGTSYTNSAGRPIAVAIHWDGDVALEVSANGTNWVLIARRISGTADTNAFAIVPPGHRYRVTGGGNAVIYHWGELR
ncbi:hypothetical protein FMZ60_08840 [Alcaligenaceae bacterium SJ-26]|nr:hypothetical protein FMZ60_08840 [Alcaligenaceae bacterium SJ-26]